MLDIQGRSPMAHADNWAAARDYVNTRTIYAASDGHGCGPFGQVRGNGAGRASAMRLDNAQVLARVLSAFFIKEP